MATPTSATVQGPWTITYSNEGISQSNTSFYYNDQVVHWLANNGLPLVNTSLSNMDSSVWYNTACAINFSTQAGGCGVMFFVVLILSKEAKRKTPIFILNILSLMFGFLRGLLFALYFLSPWVDFYPYFTSDYSAIPRSAYALSVSASTMPLFLTTTVNLSLVLQAYTVTKNMRDLHRYAVIFLSGLIFFLALGFEFALVVTNSMAIVQAKIFNAQWIQRGTLYMETISIWFFSIVFTSKLVYTLYYRRKHGWKQWSGVKILAAMGGCTMLIPSLFAILEYVSVSISNSFPEAGTIALTLVALLLPLSSLWASMSIHEESSSFDINHLSGYNMQMSNTPHSYGSNAHSKTTTSSARRTDYTAEDEKADFEEFSPTTINNKIESGIPRSGRDSTEMDLEAMGVRIDKSYSLQSTNGEGVSRK